jgi:small conductance mechanosensitive channel
MVVFLLRLIVLAQLLVTPAASPHPTSAPTHASTQVNSIASADNLVDAFDHSTLGSLFRGQKKLTPQELSHLEFWVELVKEPLLAVVGFVPRFFVAAVFMLVFWLMYRTTRRFVIGGMLKANVDPSIRDMLGHFLKWGVMGFALVIACNQVGIQITALLTGVSIMGLAIGLAAQETLANFIAALVIIWDAPFRVGHAIEVDGVMGTVQRVTFRSTRILNFDGQIIVVPNTFILARRVANLTAHRRRRVTIRVSITADSSIATARSALLATLRDDARVSPAPQPAVLVDDITGGSVRLLLQFWVGDGPNIGLVDFEYREKAKDALTSAGIALAAGQTVLIMQAPPAAETGQDSPQLRKAG